MKTLRLDVDELKVASFPVTERVRETGTAQQAWSENSICPTTAPSERSFCY
jgi:hypothetical protein